MIMRAITVRIMFSYFLSILSDSVSREKQTHKISWAILHTFYYSEVFNNRAVHFINFWDFCSAFFVWVSLSVRENKKLIFWTKVETWKAMEKLVDNGKTRTIGLSNFNKTQIIEILSIPGIKHKPAVLQNESHPYLQEKDLRDFCRLSGIAFQVS